jgi:hypothetical protein
VKAPTDPKHSYRIRFLDGLETTLKRSEIIMLAKFKEGEISDSTYAFQEDLYERVIYRCVIGSEAYGLAEAESDVDRRGIYLPTAHQHWSLYSVPEQLENHETQEAYWELQKFLILALKANPNVLECLYTPLVEKTTPLISPCHHWGDGGGTEQELGVGAVGERTLSRRLLGDSATIKGGFHDRQAGRSCEWPHSGPQGSKALFGP